MLPPQYGLVAYVRSPLGEMVEKIRRDLHPMHADVPAHISILPPRPLSGTEEEAISLLESACVTVAPFEITLGDVESFCPTTPTVFIRVAHAAYRMRELHDLLNAGPLKFDEPLPYMPHLTIGKMETLDLARDVFEQSRVRWDEFRGPRKVLIDNLSFVRGRDLHWVDLAPVRLGGVPAAKTPA